MAIIVIVMAFLVTSCGPNEVNSVSRTDQPVKVVEVKSNVAQPIRRFPGRVAASETANIASKVPGQVKAVYVEPGDEVKAGVLLLELDDIDYQLNYEQALANYNLAKVSFGRIEESRKKNIATQADYDNAKANFDKANLGLKQATNQLNDTKISAPFDATVVSVNTQQYDFIGAGQPAVYLQSVQNIDVKFQIPSDIVSRITADTSRANVDVIFESLSDKTYPATVKEFRADSDRSTRSFDVTLTLQAPPSGSGLLLPGMDATVQLDLSRISQVRHLTVPSHVVFEEAGKTYVWKVNNNTVARTGVVLGSFIGSDVIVTEGLSAGDRVVAAGIHKLVDGQTVAIWNGE